MIEACIKPRSEDVEGMLDCNFGRAAGSSDKGDLDMRVCMLALEPGTWDLGPGTYVKSAIVSRMQDKGYTVEEISKSFACGCGCGKQASCKVE